MPLKKRNKWILVLGICLLSPSIFAQKARVDSTKTTTIASDLLTFAQKHLHYRYRSGGTSPKGFDCSGFVRYCFSKFGTILPHSSAAQISHGVEIALGEAKAGDLIFFKGSNSKSTRIGHVGLIVAVGQDYVKFIHSAWKGGIRYDFLHADYYQKRYVGVRRVIKENHKSIQL
jgi:cell wall-associated NlpC family hydrolase